MLMLELSDKEIVQLSDNMTRSKKDFLTFIDYHCGSDSDEYHDAKRLVLTRSDIRKWIGLWDGNIENFSEANRLFRRWKAVDNLSGGYEEFKDLLYLDKEDFLSTYFQQEVSKRMLWELDRVLSEMSVLELAYLHYSNPHTRIEYL